VAKRELISRGVSTRLDEQLALLSRLPLDALERFRCCPGRPAQKGEHRAAPMLFCSIQLHRRMCICVAFLVCVGWTSPFEQRETLITFQHLLPTLRPLIVTY
jgi:hypothetical protein